MGYCKQDYKKLREQMHIPLVVYDGYMESSGNLVNIEVNHFDGGVQVGHYLKSRGHRAVLCISDNSICMDMERYKGLKSEIPNAELMVIPMEQKARTTFYREHLEEIKKYSAVFAVSDYYAMDFIQFLKSVGISVPADMSVVGFDNVKECEKFLPPLTTIKQDIKQRAALAVKMLNQLRDGECRDKEVTLPVTLIERGSVSDVKMHKE